MHKNEIKSFLLFDVQNFQVNRLHQTYTYRHLVQCSLKEYYAIQFYLESFVSELSKAFTGCNSVFSGKLSWASGL